MRKIIQKVILFVQTRKFKLFFVEIPLVLIFIFINLPFINSYVAPSLAVYIFIFLLLYFWTDSVYLVYLISILLLVVATVLVFLGKWYLAEVVGNYLVYTIAILLFKKPV